MLCFLGYDFSMDLTAEYASSVEGAHPMLP